MKSVRFVSWWAAATVMLAGADLKLEEVIQKHTAALGGLEKLRAIQTAKITQKMILGDGQIETPTVFYFKRPNHFRMEATFQGMRLVDGFDGAQKWSLNPTTNPAAMPAPESDRTLASEDADIFEGPLVSYKEKDHHVELVGKEDVENSTVYKLQATLKSGRIQTICLNQSTFLTIKVSWMQKQGSEEFATEIFFKDYKGVEGVQIPFEKEIRINQQPSIRMITEKVELNIPVEDTMFQMPAAPRIGVPPPASPRAQ